MTKRQKASFGAILAAILSLAGSPTDAAEVWHTTRGLNAGEKISAEDIEARETTRRNIVGIPSSEPIVGLEMRRRIGRGQPITRTDVGAERFVRPQTSVRILYKAGALNLETPGRALDGGAVGDIVRVVNPSSGRTVRGRVTGQDTVEVSALP